LERISRSARRPAAALLAGAILVPLGCGDDDKDKGGTTAATQPPAGRAPTVPAATPTNSRARLLVLLTATSAALDRSATLYAAGDKPRALDEAGSAYVDHFEQVEPALGRANHELNEELERQISTGMRDLINQGASAAQLQGRVAAIKTDLRKAYAALGGRGRPPF
jgi:high-affinity iron transporter